MTVPVTRSNANCDRSSSTYIDCRYKTVIYPTETGISTVPQCPYPPGPPGPPGHTTPPP